LNFLLNQISEGLSVFEYVTSSRGSRKGLTDTALKTADAGYLTRRLVDVAHDVIIRTEDCGAKEGLTLNRQDRPKAYLLRISGRVLTEDIKDKNGKVLIPKGDLLGDDQLKLIEDKKIDEVVVRSALTCLCRYGICATCYGRDLSKKELVDLGTPVGVVAAQSIGEPGTQLTLKTKHSAGIVGLDVTQGLPRVEELFEARTPRKY
jgi:DNA-directed RNA polymerase subunit beta'